MPDETPPDELAQRRAPRSKPNAMQHALQSAKTAVDATLDQNAGPQLDDQWGVFEAQLIAAGLPQDRTSLLVYPLAVLHTVTERLTDLGVAPNEMRQFVTDMESAGARLKICTCSDPACPGAEHAVHQILRMILAVVDEFAELIGGPLQDKSPEMPEVQVAFYAGIKATAIAISMLVGEDS